MMMVGRARRSTGISAPATSGHPDLERAYRVQLNTIEQCMMFFPALFLCAGYFRTDVAAICGGVFLIGRVIFALAYYGDPKKRGPGFLISSLALLILFLCGSFGVLRALVG